jgi:prepilin signal peptidase PulO-like enzyme (type II secretory pathway)
MVVFVTTVGPYFGATISGMLTSIPTIAAVLALFTHAQEGPDRTIGVMRGMTHGLLGFAAFLTVLSATLVEFGTGPAFGLAFTAVLVVQAIELRSALRLHRPAPAGEELLPEAAD